MRKRCDVALQAYCAGFRMREVGHDSNGMREVNMEALALVIIKAVVGTFVKYYVSSLLGGAAIAYDKGELGYKVPKWYMNPGRAPAVMYAYGTSVKGDEFESLEYARLAALKQMSETIRIANRKMVNDLVSYDSNSIKQRRLVDLFVKGDGLDDFIKSNVTVDKKQLVKMPDGDMRAFVRINMQPKIFMAYQKREVKALKTKIVHQKSDEILAEMEAEIAADSADDEVVDKPDGVEIVADSVKEKEDPTKPDEPEIISPKPGGGRFDALERELDQSGGQEVNIP
jgi:hypothetical protein